MISSHQPKYYIHPREYQQLVILLDQCDILPWVLYNLIAEYAAKVDDFQEVRQEVTTPWVDNTTIHPESTFSDCRSYIILASPPGSGKSTLISLLDYFFSMDNYNKIDDHLFDGLHINNKSAFRKNKHPVIRLNLEEIVGETLHEVHVKFQKLLTALYQQHGIRLPNHYTFTSQIDRELGYAFRRLIDDLDKKYSRKIYLLIDNYDTPLIASYYYNYHAMMLEWMNHTFASGFKDNFSYKFILFAGLGLHKDLFHSYEIYDIEEISLPFNEKYKPLLIPSQQTVPVDAHWLLDLLRKNKDSLAQMEALKAGQSIQLKIKNTFFNNDTRLDLANIQNNPKELYKFLIYTGYLIINKKLNDHTYELSPHPLLCDIIKKEEKNNLKEHKIIEQKITSPRKQISPIILEKKHEKLSTLSTQIKHFFMHQFSENKKDAKRTENIIFVKAMMRDDITYRDIEAELRVLKYNPRVSDALYEQIENKELITDVLHYCKSAEKNIFILCKKYNAKVVLISPDDYLDSDFEKTKLLFSSISFSKFIIDQIQYDHRGVEEYIENWLIDQTSKIKSFLILMDGSMEVLEKRHIYDCSLTEPTSFQKANDILKTPLNFESSSLKYHWDALINNNKSLSHFSCNAVDLCKIRIGLGWNKKKLFDTFFSALEKNRYITHLTLQGFIDNDDDEDHAFHLINRLAQLLSKRAGKLDYLSLASNSIEGNYSAMFAVLDGAQHHIPYLCLNNDGYHDGSLTMQGQLSLAKWIETYPQAITIDLTVKKSPLDACILKAVYKNNNVQLQVDSAKFSAIYTFMKKIRETHDQLRAEGRIIHKKEITHQERCSIS